MGYAVKRAKSKRRTWKLLFETRRDGTRKAPAIPTEKLGMHGFRVDMTIEEARAKASTLNAVAEEKRHAERKIAITHRMEKSALNLAHIVPDERGFIEFCKDEHRITLSGPNRLGSHWLCAKTLLADLKLEPKDYYERRRKIYRWFSDRKLSLAYLKKVLRFVNLYGEYTSDLYKSYFKPVPYPVGKDKQDINNENRKSGRANKAAKPTTLPAFSASAGKWPTEAQYNWMYLSLWLGLRPEEVDNLKDGQYHRFENDDQGTLVLVVYQTKLERSVDEKYRWKYIPLLYKEQRCIQRLIESRNFERPLVKTIAARLGPGTKLYTGRKTFEDIMMKRGQPFHFVSAMLGHQKPDITYAKYMDRTRARYVKPKKTAA